MLFRKIFRIIPKLRNSFFIAYNRIYFYLFGVKYGKGLSVKNKIYLLGKGRIEIGNHFDFSSGGNMNPICRNVRGAIFSKNHNSIVKIGDNVGISSSCVWANESIQIGNNVNIGGDCLILDNDSHPHNYLFRRRGYFEHHNNKEKKSIIPTSPIVIEDDVWIGARSIILKGVRIGARSIIAAGSIVTKDIPCDVVAGGNPCRVLRSIN